MSWYSHLFGAEEPKNMDQARAMFKRDGSRLTSLVNGQTFGCGRLELPTLAELRNRVDLTPRGPNRLSEAIGNELFGKLNNDRFEDYIDDIRIIALHLLGIINDILDLSKIEAAMLQFEWVSLDIHRIANKCAELIQTDLAAAEISLELNFPESTFDTR